MIPVEVFYKDRTHKVFHCERFGVDLDENVFELYEVIGIYGNIEDNITIKRSDVLRVIVAGI